jgi:hypothetical protein
MSLQIPRKRTILAWHRWLGIFSALFLISLSITGLALNHTEFLKLDQVQVRNSLILSRYGMASGATISAYRIQESDTIAHLDGQLFYNSEALANATRPLGIINNDPISVVATTTQLIYLTIEGEVIEIIDSGQLPYSTLEAVGYTPNGEPVLVTDEGRYIPDSNWITFDSYQGPYTVDPLTPLDLDDSARATILEQFQGGGVSLYRVLLDLHSGRLFGWGGRTAMDLTAVAILILVTSGIGGWLRKSRHSNTSPHAR